jgi:asparagine synthase (glutamine-hydrolysing)
MCGIAGSISNKNFQLEQQVSFIQNLLEKQIYRGPDHQDLTAISTEQLQVILGHNRLAIIDVNPSSNQPMWDEQKRFCLVYNGMLYNYLELRSNLQEIGFNFFSTGDTEVVLKAFMHWGLDALPRFNGMFALAIFDKKENLLYLARDRLGKKPLFYWQQGQELYFASTSHALAEHFKLQPNLNELANGLRYWTYGVNNATVYQGLNSVAPCEVITIKYRPNLEITHKKYYSLSSEVQLLKHKLSHQTPSNLIEQVHDLVTDAIKIRLRTDVNMGIALSGGLDSGLIAAFASKEQQNLTAFSYGSRDAVLTEANLTSLTAKHVGANVEFTYPCPNEMQAAFWQTLMLQDAPFPNFSIVAQYLVFKKARENNIKVMLGGQGGDEVFMGYRKYLLFYFQNLLHKGQYIAGSKFLMQLMPSFCQEFKALPNYFKNIPRYLAFDKNDRWHRFSSALDLKTKKGEELWLRQLRDIEQFSLPSLLRYEDRNSMSNSIESRFPFLDYRLIELGLALPDTLKLNQGYSKWVVREIAKNMLPPVIAHSRIKRGFDVNTPHWIRSGIGERLRESIKAHSNLLKTMHLVNQVDHFFSDDLLIKKPGRLAEAISLAWLASKPYFIW